MGAVVDLQTGKIVGCKKYSLTWWHEMGHIVYNKSPKGIKNSYWQGVSLDLTIVLLSLTFFLNLLKYLSLITVFLYFGFQFYEELWCWKYAYIKKGKGGTKPPKRNK